MWAGKKKKKRKKRWLSVFKSANLPKKKKKKSTKILKIISHLCLIFAQTTAIFPPHSFLVRLKHAKFTRSFSP